MRKLPPILALPAGPVSAGSEPSRLAEAARAGVGVTVTHDPAHAQLDFAGGDIARDRGVCTDVVIRAPRDAWAIDLQLAVNRDMATGFGADPALWGLTRTDRNIDHRRVRTCRPCWSGSGPNSP